MEIKLLIGLGNPGEEYEDTYHNIGKSFIDDLAGENAKFKKEKYFEYAKRGGQNAKGNAPILIKTMTFMNQSGGAVTAAKKYFKVRPAEILIIQDDSDIPLGQFKLSFGRGSAGHQGLESIIKSLRTNKFYRLRIGIRSPNEKRREKANNLVLKKIGVKERKILQDLFLKLRTLQLQVDSKAHPVAGSRRNA